MRFWVVVPLVVFSFSFGLAENTPDSTRPQFIGVISMTGDGWAEYPGREFPWETDLVAHWRLLRTSAEQECSVLCRDTVFLTTQDTIVLDGSSFSTFALLRRSGFLDTLGRKEAYDHWWDGMYLPNGVKYKSIPTIDCGDKKFWRVHMHRLMVLLFRVCEEYVRPMSFAYREKEITIGVAVPDDAAFAELVRKKFLGR